MSLRTRVLATSLAAAVVGLLALSRPSAAAPAPYVTENVPLANRTALRVKGEKAFIFRSRFHIDADGAPKAYHPAYTCDASYGKGWKRATKIDCEARTAEACRVNNSGFKDDPAPGTVGELVSCNTKYDKAKKAWVCGVYSSTRETQGGCNVDATGNSGLDYLANAGEPGNFYGIIAVPAKTGTPVIQGPSDPAPGYYVSGTSLVNPAVRDDKSPSRYVDSSTTNYIALPPNAAALGAQVGDFAWVINWKTGAQTGAIFADSGNNRELGEGSIALAAALGVKGTPKGGGQVEDIVYIVFPGTSQGFPKNPNQPAALGLVEFMKWGGALKLFQVIPKDWVDAYPSKKDPVKK
jgi:hypothetical protein